MRNHASEWRQIGQPAGFTGFVEAQPVRRPFTRAVITSGWTSTTLDEQFPSILVRATDGFERRVRVVGLRRRSLDEGLVDGDVGQRVLTRGGGRRILRGLRACSWVWPSAPDAVSEPVPFFPLRRGRRVGAGAAPGIERAQGFHPRRLGLRCPPVTAVSAGTWVSEAFPGCSPPEHKVQTKAKAMDIATASITTARRFSWTHSAISLTVLEATQGMLTPSQ